METLQLEKLAARNEPMPEKLNAAEQILYQGLCLLHSRYRDKMLDTAAAKREKRELLKQYETNCFQMSLWEQTNKKWSALAGPLAGFRKNPNIEDAEMIVAILDGVSLEAKRQRERWKSDSETNLV